MSVGPPAWDPALAAGGALPPPRLWGWAAPSTFDFIFLSNTGADISEGLFHSGSGSGSLQGGREGQMVLKGFGGRLD